MKNYFGLKNSKNIKSQIAIIITFAIAVIILMVIVFMNIAKVSEVKTLTARVSDSAALRLGSSIGSMANYLKQEALNGKEKICTLTFLGIFAFAAGLFVLTGGNLFIAILGISVISGIGFSPDGLKTTFTSSSSINKEIFETFSEMSRHNSFREQALYEAISSLQTDDVLLAPIGPEGGGIFAEDLDGDGEADSGGRWFDLSEIDEVKNAPVVGRFFAWYHERRLPLVSEQGLKAKINDFLDDLQEYISMEEWDSDKWIYKKVYFRIKEDGRFSITGTTPSWVKDSDTINILSIDEADKDENNNYNPKGFLKEKFTDLAEDLEDDYDLISCDQSWLDKLWGNAKCGMIDAVIKDIRDLTAYTKEIVELPETSKVVDIAQWFEAKFYDEESTEDIYDRLTRSKDEIQNWIKELGDLDVGIRDDIPKPRGECSWGRGSGAGGSCYTRYGCSTSECGCTCCCSDDCTGGCCCCNTCCYPSSYKSPCIWEGIYYTCCKNPPVCSNGDLYKKIPSWCSVHGDHSGCDSHCSCTASNDFDCSGVADDYQGLLAYNNTAGLTEVGQTIEVLIALKEDLDNIKILIENFSADIEVILAKDDALKNQIVYAWEGKIEEGQERGRRHLVSVKIDDYPEKLPYILEKEKDGWFSLWKCYELMEHEGSFTVSASRYDESVSLSWWNMRYQKEEGEDLAVADDLGTVIAIIQNDAQVPIENYKMAIDNLITGVDPSLNRVLEKAIPSETKGYYGPDKKNIYIKRVK